MFFSMADFLPTSLLAESTPATDDDDEAADASLSFGR
jgi:hypothetical protein